MNSLRFTQAVLPFSFFLGCITEVHGERAALDPPSELLAVDMGSGDVRVTGADVPEITVVSKVAGASNRLAWRTDGGRLTLFADCHEEPCWADVDAYVPAGLPLDVHTGSGDVRIDGQRASITLDTGSGNVRARDLRGAVFSAETGSGDVDVRDMDFSERIHVKAGSGDVTLAVPTGGYRLDVSTGSGDARLDGVAKDPNAPSAIDVNTGSGDVTIFGR